MTPDDLTPDPETAAADAADDAHTERWREAKARGREHDAIVEDWWAEVGLLDRLSVADLIARVRADERERAAGRVQALIDDGPHYEACPHWGADFDDMLEMVRVGIACECALIGDTCRDALAAIREGGA